MKIECALVIALIICQTAAIVVAIISGSLLSAIPFIILFFAAGVIAAIIGKKK